MATKSAASRSRSKSGSKAKSKRQPWDKPAPRGSRHTKLTGPQKAEPKAAAKRAGRRYPNLVDNMRVAAGGKRKKRGKKS